MMPETATATAAVFGAVFVLLYVAHHIGDHWGQRSIDAVNKQRPGRVGAFHCAVHVAMITTVKVVVLVLGLVVLGLPVSAGGVVLALVVDAGSHYLVDRGEPLRKLAYATGNAGYVDRVTVVRAPDQAPAANGPGTGAFHLDQSWHFVWLVVAALIIAATSV